MLYIGHRRAPFACRMTVRRGGHIRNLFCFIYVRGQVGRVLYNRVIT